MGVERLFLSANRQKITYHLLQYLVYKIHHPGQSQRAQENTWHDQRHVFQSIDHIGNVTVQNGVKQTVEYIGQKICSKTEIRCFLQYFLDRIGPTLGATIFSEIGDISRFESSAKLAAFAGIDPTVTQSGEFIGTHNHMSKRGSPYLRRALWQASTAAATFDPHMRAFFQKKRAEGKPYMNAIGHVTRKMTNIIFAVLRDNKPYYNPDEQ